ncbi:MAG: hypothetical protein ACPHDL_06875, partial [Limisphaerales bacterium]
MSTSPPLNADKGATAFGFKQDGQKPPRKAQKRAWNHQEKQAKIDINRFRAKYDFDIAKTICPMVSGVEYHEDYQDIFKNNAIMEIFQECSNRFSKGKKIYQSLY